MGRLRKNSFRALTFRTKKISPHRYQAHYHTLEALEIIEQDHYSKPGRLGKQTQPTHKTYHVQATLVINETVLEQQKQQAGRFILATNVLDKEQLNIAVNNTVDIIRNRRYL